MNIKSNTEQGDEIAPCSFATTKEGTRAMSIENIKLIWNTIAIDVTYNNDWAKSHREIMGFSMGHLEIKSEGKARLPITETGYKSHFIAATVIEEYGGAEKYVCDWLEEKSKSKVWKDYWRKSKQLSLF